MRTQCDAGGTRKEATQGSRKHRDVGSTLVSISSFVVRGGNVVRPRTFQGDLAWRVYNGEMGGKRLLR